MSRTFSCDSCSAPVGLYDESCPRCGKRFDAVRCPRCGHQGAPAAFEQGCPSCRYLAPAKPPISRPHPRRRQSRFVPAMAVLLVFLAGAVLVTWLLRRG